MKRTLNTTINRYEERNADTFGYNDRSEVTSATICGIANGYGYDAFGNTIAKSGLLADFFRHCFSTKYFDND